MALTKFQTKRIEKHFTAWCEKTVPLRVQDRFRVGFELSEDEARLFELRQHWQDTGTWDTCKVVRFKEDATTSPWQFYCPDRKGRWHFYGQYPNSTDIEKLLVAVEKNAAGIFCDERV